MLIYTLKPVTSGANTYAAGQFVEMSAAHGASFITAGSGVNASTMDAIKVTALVQPAATAVAAPASATFEFCFSAATPTPVALAAITASVTTAPAKADDVGVITIAGGPAKSAGNLKVTIAVDSGADVVINAAIAKGDTAGVVGGTLMASFAATPVTSITPTTSATGVITLTPATGKNITKLTVAVTGSTR